MGVEKKAWVAGWGRGEERRGERSIMLVSFACLSFHNFFLSMPAGAFACLVSEPKDRSTPLRLIQVGRGCGSRVVTLPDVPKLWLGRFQQQSHSVNSSLFLPWVGGDITRRLYYPRLTFQEAHRPEPSQVTLSSKNLWEGIKDLQQNHQHAGISALNPIHGFLGNLYFGYYFLLHS